VSNLRANEDQEMSEIKEVVIAEGSPRGDREKSVEVLSMARRRRFSAQYKLRLLDEVDSAGPGEIGLILRRKGLYSSHLTKWRQWRMEMSGKKVKKKSKVSSEVKALMKENAKKDLRIRKLEAMLDLQKKAAAIWELAEEQSEIDS